ncbi:MAG TPA: protein kinase [Ktedonobacteraceae bacterium]|nr:protein kinase [Ktedonobacteraceae bacterium]
MNELAGKSLGGYQLDEEIGRGSMGVVYRGKQMALGREVAIKVLPHTLARDSSYVARFIREAQIIAGLNHPNIVQIYDAGQQNKLLYFVMEYVQGPTLANLLHLDGTLPQYLAAEYAAQIADALDAAYQERHVIHRDIKPENLMLNRWGKIKVMDFGLARATGHQRITVAKTLVGSIYYASPEQVWGQTLDNRSDIYALGVVLYEMVTGKRPFSGRSMPELTQAIVRGKSQPPRTINPAVVPQLEEIILTALSKDREQRYESASRMAQLLRSLQLQPTTSSAELPPSTPNVRERMIVQPPKRPQAPRPLYQDIELEQTQPPPRQNVDLEQTQPPTGEPDPQIATARTYQQLSSSREVRMGQDQLAHSPTNAAQSNPRFYQKLSGGEEEIQVETPYPYPPPKRGFWGQLQKLLKKPPH